VIRPRFPRLTFLAQKIKRLSGLTHASRCGRLTSRGSRPVSMGNDPITGATGTPGSAALADAPSAPRKPFFRGPYLQVLLPIVAGEFYDDGCASTKPPPGDVSVERAGLPRLAVARLEGGRRVGLVAAHNAVTKAPSIWQLSACSTSLKVSSTAGLAATNSAKIGAR